MSEKKHRVIQWATGTVGKVALMHIIENPHLELVGVLVTNPEKVGKDAGDLVGLPATGVLATDDVEAILALDADCVHFAPMLQDLDMVCRLLRSGKNVVSMIGPFFEYEYNHADVAKVDAAAKEGGVSFFATGIHPRYIGDIMPMTQTRLVDRIDTLQVYEIADKQTTPSVYIDFMGFGQTPEELASKPNVMAQAKTVFGESMAFVLAGLGKQMEDLTETHEVAIARNDIPYPGGIIKKGTVAGQHWEWTMWTDGKPVLVYHLYYFLGNDTEPQWNLGESRHRIVFEGNPNMEMTLKATPEPDGTSHFLGIIWTALLGATSIPAVCGARPGAVNHFDLGVVQPRGLIR